MGLFGSSTKTYYSSTSALLFEAMPSVITQTVGAAITQNRNISTDLITNLTNGIGFKMDRLYDYGLRDYPYGLPEGSTGTLPPNMYRNVKLVIESEEDQPIFLNTCVTEVNPNTSQWWYKATYQLIDNTGVILPEIYDWSYNEASGVYEVLDIPRKELLGNSPFFPIIPLRIDNVSQVDEGMPDRDALIRAGDYLGLDVVQISDSMKEQYDDTGENPVEDAFVVTGVEIAEEAMIGIEYMFTFFSTMYSESLISKEDFVVWADTEGSDKGTPPMNSVVIADSSYKMELGWLYIELEVKTGVIAVVGEYTREYLVNSGDVDTAPGVASTTTYSTSSMVFRKQMNDTQYSEVTVVGLVHTNWAVGKELRTTLADAHSSDELAQSFVIPLRTDLLNILGAVRQHDLAYISIRLILNDELVEKLKWYQTGFFQFVILVVSIVISIWFPPAGIAAFSSAAVGIALVQVIAMKLLLPIVLTQLEDILGEELTLLINVIVSLYVGGISVGTLISSALQVASSISTLQFESAMSDISQELASINEEIAKELDANIDTHINVMGSLALREADTFNTSTPHDYVRRVHYDVREPLYITDTTQYFIDINKYTDRPDSPIRLGQEL